RGFLEIGSTALAAAGAFSAIQASAQEQNASSRRDRKISDPVQENDPMEAQNPDSVRPPSTDAGSVPTFKYALAHKRLQAGGWSREVTVRELPVSTTIAGVNMRLTAGGVRELHWHTAGE